MHELVCFDARRFSNSNAFRYQIRQDLTPEFISILPTLNGRNNNSQRNSLTISPDGTKMLFAHIEAHTSNNNKFWTITDFDNPQPTQPIALFDGILYAIASSNTHYALAGTNPFLRVYDWQHQVLNIDTKGLSNVYGACFNDDGSKLFVIYDRAPHLRVYDLVTLSYKDVATPVNINSSFACIYYAFGQLLFFGSTTANYSYFKMFDDELNQTFSFNNNNQYANYGSNYICRLLKHPIKDGTLLLIRINNSNKLEVSELVLSPTPAITRVLQTDFGNLYSVCCTDGHIYLCHAYHNTAHRTISVYRLSDYAFDETQTSAFAPFHNDIIDFVVIKKDTGKITGTVRDINNNPASRMVRAYDRKTGELIAQTQSQTDGNYRLMLPSTDDVDVQFMAQDGELLNDLFYAKVTPELVP